MMTKRRSPAFILLEVLISVVIIGVSVVALMKGLLISMDTLRKVRMNETAIYLARSVMDDFQIEPPADGDYEGHFADDDRYGEAFNGWYWELQVEADEPDYDKAPRGRMLSGIELLYYTRLIISYDPEAENTTSRRRSRGADRLVYIDIQTILMEPDVFSLQAIERNQLF